jgi:hypothetical protein
MNTIVYIYNIYILNIYIIYCMEFWRLKLAEKVLHDFAVFWCMELMHHPSADGEQARGIK